MEDRCLKIPKPEIRTTPITTFLADRLIGRSRFDLRIFLAHGPAGNTPKMLQGYDRQQGGRLPQ
jgi:hypothetical protein